MDGKRKWLLGGALALILVGGGAVIAVATGSGDDAPIPASKIDQATAAALEHSGGGTVIETEVGDDGAAYGVEIRLDDGSVVEVNLDESLNVIGDEPDEDGPNEQEEPADG